MPDAEEPTFTAEELDDSLRRSLHSDRSRDALGGTLETALSATLSNELLKQLITSALQSGARGTPLTPEAKRVVRRSARNALSPERISALRQVVTA